MSMPAQSSRPVTGDRPGKREQNKRDKFARIIVAARALFRAKGFGETTTQEIADAADIGTGTLFLYVKSKEDLLILLFRDEILKLVERDPASRPGSKPIAQQVDSLFEAFINYHKRDIALAQALIRELTFLSNPERHADVLEIPAAIVARLEGLLRHAQARGELRRSVDLQPAAQCLFGIYYQQLQGWLAGYVTYDQFRTNLKSLVGFMIDGMRERAKPRRTGRA